MGAVTPEQNHNSDEQYARRQHAPDDPDACRWAIRLMPTCGGPHRHQPSGHVSAEAPPTATAKRQLFEPTGKSRFHTVSFVSFVRTAMTEAPLIW